MVIDHWKKGWLDHDEEDIHMLFLNAGLAAAVVAPWKQGTGVVIDVYSKRNGILGILAPKPAWRDALVEPSVEVAVKDKSWGDWPQVYNSMERWMIWRIAAIVPKRPHSHSESSAVLFAVNLLGMETEKAEEDREWFRSYPDIAGLLCFALQQPPSISDTAFQTIDNKAAAWFDHDQAELHQIFIDQGLAPALIRYLSHELQIGKSDRRDRILRTLLSSQLWLHAFYRSVVLNVNDAREDDNLDIGARARSVLDLHRLSMKSSSHAEPNIDAEAWTSDQALRIVMDYVERRKSELQEVELVSCWNYPMAACERITRSRGRAIDGGETERIQVTFRCKNDCCRWTVGKPGVTSLLRPGLPMSPRIDRRCGEVIGLA
ncbi:hypothetical protein FRB98_009014 [Tulasnella sp. 332]|nr:hypothetical protein FRB98_009014 [Tulasnella sp. 332]